MPYPGLSNKFHLFPENSAPKPSIKKVLTSLKWSIVQAENDYDPFPEFIYLGDSIEDGLLAWIQIGINVTADQSDSSYYSVVAHLEADGGHATSSSTTGGSGMGGGDFNGTAPDNATTSTAV
jgi:hypothetical protein